MTKQQKLTELKKLFSEIGKLGVEFYRIEIIFTDENFYSAGKSNNKPINMNAFLDLHYGEKAERG
jgi:hypothetical protein